MSLCQVCWYSKTMGQETSALSYFCINWFLINVCTVQFTFPDVAIAPRMFLVLIVTNCSAERSFSKLKQIENCLRTSITQGKLVNLALSTESNILREIDFTAIISDFAVAKSRKVSGLSLTVLDFSLCEFVWDSGSCRYMSRLYHSLGWYTRVYTTRDYDITYLFHDRRATANTGLRTAR